METELKLAGPQLSFLSGSQISAQTLPIWAPYGLRRSVLVL